VFYVNIPPGLIAAALVAFAWQDQAQSHARPAVDYWGAALLSAGVVALLLGLVDFGTTTSWTLIAASVVLFILLIWVERRAADPILPIHLFRDRLFSTSIAHGVLSGWALFGSLSFIPLFVQSVLGTTATEAGITIAPMLLGWVTSSIIGTRILLQVGYRRLAIIGTAFLTVGAFLMSSADANISRSTLMIFVSLMGIGMGLSIPSFLIAVQTSVERRQLGTATSTMQFSRSIGGTLGVSIMGAALSARLASNLSASGLDPELVSHLLDPVPGAQAVINEGARIAVADAITLVFLFAFFAAGLALVATLFTPRTELKERTTEKEPMPISAD
jgi:MFS family permease